MTNIINSITLKVINVFFLRRQMCFGYIGSPKNLLRYHASFLICTRKPPPTVCFSLSQMPQTKAIKMHTNKVNASHATNFTWCTVPTSPGVLVNFNRSSKHHYYHYFQPGQVSSNAILKANHRCLSKFWWF